MTRPRGVRQAAGVLKQRAVPTTQYANNNCSMTLRPGEVVLIRIDYHQASGGKIRPAVVLLESGDDDFVAAHVDCSLLRKRENV